MNYLPFVTILFILLVILFLLIKPITFDRQKNNVYANEIKLYFNKLIHQELKSIANNGTEEDYSANDNYRAEIIAILNKNPYYATSSLEEQEFIFLAKKRERISGQINELESKFYLNQISNHDYETEKANLTKLLRKTEEEIAPYIA